ncbi:hypothetical protein [Kitasatospora cinereorecta]|uniref:Small CPxCG-related zinc finger protein n=1 Tax=Kitasatospora cinereorecta TaxID=285560 RepID=A0ABW0V7C8_9ACTN
MGGGTYGTDPVEGGESACWLDRVCPDCGRLQDRPVEDRCAACAADAGVESSGPADGGQTV